MFPSLWRLNPTACVTKQKDGVVREQLDSCLSSAMLALQLVNLPSGVTLIFDNPSSKGVQLRLVLTSVFDLKLKRPETWSIAAQPSWYLTLAVTRLKLGPDSRQTLSLTKMLYQKPYSLPQYCWGMTNMTNHGFAELSHIEEQNKKPVNGLAKYIWRITEDLECLHIPVKMSGVCNVKERNQDKSYITRHLCNQVIVYFFYFSLFQIFLLFTLNL